MKSSLSTVDVRSIHSQAKENARIDYNPTGILKNPQKSAWGPPLRPLSPFQRFEYSKPTLPCQKAIKSTMPTFQDTPLSKHENLRTDAFPTHIESHERQITHPSEETIATSGSGTMSHNLDFYQFEWFHFLVAHILLCSIELSGYFLGNQDFGGALESVFVGGSILLGVASVVASVWAFSFIFLLLQHRRTTVKSVLESYLHVPRRCHRTLHRVALLTWLLVSVGMSTLIDCCD